MGVGKWIAEILENRRKKRLRLSLSSRFLGKMRPAAQAVIDRLGLEPLPEEGGWFRRVHTDERLGPDGRALSSVIYYLMTEQAHSALHCLAEAAETFHWHAGDAAEMLQLGPGPEGRLLRLGPNIAAGEAPYALVPAGAWQGSRLAASARHGYALFSVVVVPEFRWEDFEIGDGPTLTAAFPDWAEAIPRFLPPDR